MLSESEFWQAAAQVASERGGLVVGFTPDSDQPALGSMLNEVLGFKPRTPVSVTAVSDSTDWQGQVEAFYRLRPSWGRGKSADPSARYYRVTFDTSAMAATAPAPPSFLMPSLSRYEESGLRGVSFWPRVLARVIDFVAHYLFGFVAGIIFVSLLAIASGGQPPVWVLRRISQTRFPLFAAGLFGSVAYHVICVSVSGSTLGKRLLSMQVVQDDGSPCGVKSALIREFGYFVDALFFGVIGYFAMKDDPRQKRHGDTWADTIVANRANVPNQSQQGATRFLLGAMVGAFADIAFLMLGLLIQINA